jgi:hypothetical protein
MRSIYRVLKGYGRAARRSPCTDYRFQATHGFKYRETCIADALDVTITIQTLPPNQASKLVVI